VARLEEKLADLEARLASVETATCPICYDAPRTATLTPCCRQTFCLECLCECMKKKATCPLCRQSVGSVSKLMVVGNGPVTENNVENVVEEPKVLTKGAALLKLLSESTENDRILVFSAHEASFKGLREMLAGKGIKCELLMGSAARVEKLRKQFRDGKVRVLCMNARHVGAGINLEAATHVVLYHKMNVEMERQVIGRAVRFERATELKVVHLVHEGETAGSSGSTEIIVHV
jgi:SNF2 family DNA or RNA helicase